MKITTVSKDELESLCWGATVAGIEPKPEITCSFRNGTEIRELILPDHTYEARIPVAEVAS